jgi:hypothetical protein
MDCICGGSGNPRLFAFTLALERFLPTVRAFAGRAKTGGARVPLDGACESGAVGIPRSFFSPEFLEGATKDGFC